MESATYDPTALVAGPFPIVSKNIILKAGAVYPKGSVLGAIDVGAPAVAAKAGGNTGNGTLTMDGTTPIRPGAKAGVYQVRFTAAATNNGTARVTDPDGFLLGDVVMAGGAGAFDNDIKFALADGATDFIVGDGFDITVAQGSGLHVVSVAAAVDGSAVPTCILPMEVDATGGNRPAPAWISGEVAAQKLNFGAGHNAASVENAFRRNGTPIFIKTLG